MVRAEFLKHEGKDMDLMVKRVISIASPRIVPELGDVYHEFTQHEPWNEPRFLSSRLIAYRTPMQRRGQMQDGEKLRRVLMSIPRIRLNANVLDYQIEHQDYPVWARKYRWMYWGTRFFCRKGFEFLRFSLWNQRTRMWECDSMCVDAEFSPRDVVALYGDPLE